MNVTTKSGKEVHHFVKSHSGYSGYVMPTPNAAAGRYETWCIRGLASHVKEDDLSWAPEREREITYSTLNGFTHIRTAQNHVSAILFRDGHGITICRGTELVRIAYAELSSNFEFSRDGIAWSR